MTRVLGTDGDAEACWLGQALAAVAAGTAILLVADGDTTLAAMVAAWVREAGWPAIAVARSAEPSWAEWTELGVVIAGNADLAARATRMMATRSGARHCLRNCSTR